MLNTKLVALAILLVGILAVSAASAEDNQTQDLTDLNASIYLSDEMAQSMSLNDNCYDLKVDAPEDYKENVSIYVDEEMLYEKNVTIGSYGIYPFDYSLGNHTLRVNFPQTAVYRELNLTRNFTIYETLIQIGSTSEYAYVNVKTANDVTGYLTIFTNGTLMKKVDLANVDGAVGYSTQLLNLNPGTYNVTVVYSGDDKYKRAERSKTVTLMYLMRYEKEFDYYGDNIMGISLPSGIENKDIDVVIDGKNHAVEYDSEFGYFKVNLSDLSIGKHSVSITYNGDSAFPKQTVNDTIIISSNINHQWTHIYGNGSFVSLKLPGDEKGNLSLYVSKDYINSSNPNDLYAVAPLSDGIANITLSGFDVGTYRIFAHYDGPTHVEDLVSSISVIPEIRIPCQIEYGSQLTISAIGSENAFGTVEGVIEDEESGEREFSFDIVSGMGNFTINNLPSGKLNVKMEYVLNYTTMGSYSFSVTVIKLTPVLSQNRDVSMYYQDGSKFCVKVKDQFGKYSSGREVKFTVGSKTYHAFTNSKGVASLKITEKPGKYRITATYGGVSVTNRITVKKILTLNTVKVKKSARKVVLTAKLAKKLMAKQITFKFNGKKFKTVKTDRNGVAKVTVKSNVLKKLKVGKKLTYQATYLKETVKKSVKVGK